jgi:hypothetical protein
MAACIWKGAPTGATDDSWRQQCASGADSSPSTRRPTPRQDRSEVQHSTFALALIKNSAWPATPTLLDQELSDPIAARTAACQCLASCNLTASCPLAAGPARPYDIFIPRLHTKHSYAEPLAYTLRLLDAVLVLPQFQLASCSRCCS